MDPVRRKFNSGYLVSIPACLKYAEIVSSILTFAIAAGAGPLFRSHGGGWVEFTGVIGFLVGVTFLFMYFFNKRPDVSICYIVEPITNGVLGIFNLISGTVAAYYLSRWQIAQNESQAGIISFIQKMSFGTIASNYSYGWSTSHVEAGVVSFFAFLSMVLFALDAVIVLINNRKASSSTITTNQTNFPSQYAIY